MPRRLRAVAAALSLDDSWKRWVQRFLTLSVSRRSAQQPLRDGRVAGANHPHRSLWKLRDEHHADDLTPAMIASGAALLLKGKTVKSFRNTLRESD